MSRWWYWCLSLARSPRQDVLLSSWIDGVKALGTSIKRYRWQDVFDYDITNLNLPNASPTTHGPPLSSVTRCLSSDWHQPWPRWSVAYDYSFFETYDYLFLMITHFLWLPISYDYLFCDRPDVMWSAWCHVIDFMSCDRFVYGHQDVLFVCSKSRHKGHLCLPFQVGGPFVRACVGQEDHSCHSDRVVYSIWVILIGSSTPFGSYWSAVSFHLCKMHSVPFVWSFGPLTITFLSLVRSSRPTVM